MTKIECPAGGDHWWGFWRIISDPINIDAGDTEGFVYVRDCTKFGCSVLQRVKRLEPVDEPETCKPTTSP